MPPELWLVRLLICLIALRLVELFPWLAPLRPGILIPLLAIGVITVRSTPAERRALFRNPIFLLTIGYLLWAVVGAPFALWPGGTLQILQMMVIGLIIVGSILLVRLPALQVVDDLLQTVVIASALFAAFLMLRGVEVVPDRFEVGASLDPNDAAAIFSTAIVFALGLVRRARLGPRLVWIAVACLLALAVVKTGSRGGTLAVLAALTVFVGGLHGGRRLTYGALAGLLLIGGWQVAPETYRERMRSLASGEQDYNYTAFEGRKQIWTRGWGYWRENPVTGVGMGNFGVAEGDYLVQLGRTGKWSAPHNSYMQAFAEFGTPGGLIFLFLVGISARTAARFWRARTAGAFHRPELLAGVAGFAVASYFLSNAYSYFFFTLFGILGLLMAVRFPGGPGRTHVDPTVTGRWPPATRFRPGVMGPAACIATPPVQTPPRY